MPLFGKVAEDFGITHKEHKTHNIKFLNGQEV